MLTLIVLLGVGLVSAGPNPDHTLPVAKIVGPPTNNELGATPYARFPPGFKNVTKIAHEEDLILTEEQHQMLFETDAHGRTRRKAWKGEKFRWTDNTMPYFFNGDDYTDHQKREIREAMDVYEAETCLKFRPATSSDVNKVRFKQGQGCNSQLGMVGGTQDLNLDVAGCRWKGLYWHEIGHAIGLVHEHQLPERDRFLKVNWNNVNPAFYDAFSTYKDSELERFGIPYDLSSIMHYEVKAFSQTGGQTIIPRDQSKLPWIGNVWISQMSFTDVMIVNRMYKCADHCPQISCEGGFINKECQCVTPESYFDSHCVNEHDNEDECYERAHKGDCDRDYGFMNFKCRKACDRCAMYGMEKLIKGKPGQCYNQYFDDARCDAWAKAGDCERYPSWMKRQCKKSCGTCDSEWGKCPNMEFDQSCDDWAKRGECEANAEWMKNRCSDSCKTCGYITRGNCENDHPNEDECLKWSRAGQCYDDDLTRAFWMKKNCAASCNSCGFAKGQCENELDDFECDKLAHYGECSTNPRHALAKCKKSCNSCDYGIRGNCKNLYETMYGDSYSCDSYADDGTCDFNKGFLMIFCASSCNRCEETKDLIANCRDLKSEEECQKWKKGGECDNNGGFMRFNCAKTCNSCHMLTDEKFCGDIAGSVTCEFWKGKGECESNPHFMERNCRLTCNMCQAGEKVIKDPEWPKCVNVAEDSSCDNWARSGECEGNANWMQRNCHRSCNNQECGGDIDLTDRCVNMHENCQSWAEGNQCEANPGYMLKNCYKACNPDKCGGDGTGGDGNGGDGTGGDGTGGDGDKCVDKHENCPMWKEWGHCTEAADYMQSNCYKSCNPDKCSGGSSAGKCVDERAECGDWHSWGHCELNETVKKVCPKSCEAC